MRTAIWAMALLSVAAATAVRAEEAFGPTAVPPASQSFNLC